MHHNRAYNLHLPRWRWLLPTAGPKSSIETLLHRQLVYRCPALWGGCCGNDCHYHTTYRWAPHPWCKPSCSCFPRNCVGWFHTSGSLSRLQGFCLVHSGKFRAYPLITTSRIFCDIVIPKRVSCLPYLGKLGFFLNFAVIWIEAVNITIRACKYTIDTTSPLQSSNSVDHRVDSDYRLSPKTYPSVPTTSSEESTVAANCTLLEPGASRLSLTVILPSLAPRRTTCR